MKIDSNILARLIRLRAAGHEEPEQLHAVREAVAFEIVGAELIQRDEAARLSAYPSSGYLTPYQATAEFAEAIQSAIAWYATNNDRKPPGLSRYHPDSALPAMFKDVWEARQLCDQVGMPYAFFAQQAVRYWASMNTGRLPRPTQLCSPQVMTRVAALWADPYMRAHFALPTATVDPRFDPNNFTGDPVQLAVLRLVDERVANASRIHGDPADVLAEVLGVNVSEVEARVRYGDPLVDQAKQRRIEQDRDLQATLDGMQVEAQHRDGEASDADVEPA